MKEEKMNENQIENEVKANGRINETVDGNTWRNMLREENKKIHSIP